VGGLSGATYELGHEGNHEVEKTDGLDESETKNGVGEKLATHGGVAGNGVEEGSENETDTDTSTGKTDRGSTHTQVLGDLNHGVGDLGRVGALLDTESIAGGGVDDGVHLCALEGLHGRLAGDCGSLVSDRILHGFRSTTHFAGENFSLAGLGFIINIITYQ